MRSALAGAHRSGFNSGSSSSRAHPARHARTPTLMPICSALLKWFKMGMVRIDSACVCEQSYPYLLRDLHPRGHASELNSGVRTNADAQGPTHEFSGCVRIQTMATVRTQPKVIKANEVVDTSRAAAL